MTVVSRVIVLLPLLFSFSHAEINSPELDAELAAEASLRSGAVTKVKPFKCSQHSGPLQTLWGQKEFYLTEQTLNGNTTIYTIPRNRTDPPFEQLNACGINPIDDILYCFVNVSSTTYWVRIDEKKVEYVAKMPSWSWAAAFSSVGTYYFGDGGKYYRVEKAAELIGYASNNVSQVKDLSQMSSFANLWNGADMVVVRADVEGTGAAEYIMTLGDSGKLRVTRATGQVKSWLLQSKPELDTPRTYGAAWVYQSRVFFSQNKAGGTYEVFTDSIDLVAGTVHIEKVGPSFESQGTDGANCINIEIPSKFSNKCGSKVGAYNAITRDDPFPPPGATNVRPNQELIFLPSHDDSVIGYQVFLGPAMLKTDGSVASVEWHLACNLPCGVNVCKPPYGLDNTLGGNFAWRVDQLKVDGKTVSGTVWQFSLMQTVTYAARAVADTYIDKNGQYADKRHMLMRARTEKNPQFGFVKFQLPPPTYAGVSDCSATVMRAEIRLTVLSVSMQDVMVYLIPPEKDDFDKLAVTRVGDSIYPFVFNNSTLVNHVYGPVAPKKSFTIDVTDNVSEIFKAGEKNISFGLETSSAVSRFCAQSKTKPRTENWCYPRLEVLLGLGDCPVTAQDPSCSNPADSPPGPLDAMCGNATPTFPGTPTNWREDTAITTTTTTTTTKQAAPIKEGHCRYNDHVVCPWPHSDTMCSGDQCCPDGSTCPSSSFAQAQGCNLKKHDCTALVPANWTCRESEEVFCPGTDVKCSGDTCCPNNTTCPSASVMAVPSCGNKMVDCQAPLSAEFNCAIGEFVFCPATDSHIATRNDKCHGNQCCPDGSTCPSAPDAIADGCGPKKATCELLAWNVKLIVTSIVFANVTHDTIDLVETLTGHAIASTLGVDSTNLNVTSSDGDASGLGRRLSGTGMIINAKISAPGGWSQKKFDSTVESNILSEDLRVEMEELLSEVDGLQEASSGDMAMEQIKAVRDDPPETSSTPSPQSSNSSTESLNPPSPSTSLRGSGEPSDNQEMSSATTCSFLPGMTVSLVSIFAQFLRFTRDGAIM